MRQELIDLLLGELDPAEAERLEARLARDMRLAREFQEVKSLFSLMRRGERVEPSPAVREAVLAAAERVRPPLRVRLRELPGLVAYRFRHSLRFRVALVSLCAHLLLIAALAQILLTPSSGPREPPEVVVLPEGQPPVRPEQAFVTRLAQRRLPQTVRLRQFGVADHEEAIRAGLDALLARQDAEGAFGTVEETAYAALAFLAEGECSTRRTPRGQAVRLAVGRLLREVDRGASHGAILAALVEDYTLSYDALDEQDRVRYARAIGTLLREALDDEISGEARVLAHLAGFPVPAPELAEAGLFLSGDRSTLLGEPPTRLRATIVLARGRFPIDAERVRAWAAPLFERAVAEIRAGKASGLVLLTLQAPYRL